MLTQREWVEGCYTYYAENYYQPGNPEDGEWHEAHYPTPGCLGGVDTVLLLKQHHAVQGVLQSEEHQHPCIWGWEVAHLSGEVLRLYQKWRGELARLSHANRTTEQRSVAARAWQTKRTPEQRRAATTAANATVRALHSKRTLEQRRAATAAARAATTHTHKQKPVCVTYPDGGTITYRSITAAAFVLQLPRHSVSNALRVTNGHLYHKYKKTGIRIEYA